MKNKEYARLGWAGYGPTMKEAKQDWEQRVERIIRNTGAPYVYARGNWIVIVFPVAEQFGYLLVRNNPTMGHQNRGHTVGYSTSEAAVLHAWRHVAQIEFTFEDDAHSYLEPYDREGLAFHKEWALYQHRCKAWRMVIPSIDDLALQDSANTAWPPGYPPTYNSKE